MILSIGGADRSWVARNLAEVESLALVHDAEASVYAVRATVFVESSRAAEILAELADTLQPSQDYRWMNISE